MCRKVIVNGIFLLLIFLSCITSASEKKIIESKFLLNSGLYIPQTQKQATDFWTIPSLCVIDIEKKVQAYTVCSEYLEALFRNASSQEDLQKILIFHRLSDGMAAEMFDDYWGSFIKKKYPLFKKFYLKLDKSSKDQFQGVFDNLFYNLPVAEKEKIKKELGIRNFK